MIIPIWQKGIASRVVRSCLQPVSISQDRMSALGNSSIPSEAGKATPADCRARSPLPSQMETAAAAASTAGAGLLPFASPLSCFPCRPSFRSQGFRVGLYTHLHTLYASFFDHAVFARLQVCTQLAICFAIVLLLICQAMMSCSKGRNVIKPTLQSGRQPPSKRKN